MRSIFSEQAWSDYLEWQGEPRALRRVNAILRDTARSPYDGIAKPEPLKQNLSGYWSRRITDEHRMVYRVEGDDLLIAQLRHHYGE